jgi:hypothetical protein
VWLESDKCVKSVLAADKVTAVSPESHLVVTWVSFNAAAIIDET